VTCSKGAEFQLTDLRQTLFCDPEVYDSIGPIAYQALVTCYYSGTFTAADLIQLKTAFQDTLLVVEKDGILQVGVLSY